MHCCIWSVEFFDYTPRNCLRPRNRDSLDPETGLVSFWSRHNSIVIGRESAIELNWSFVLLLSFALRLKHRKTRLHCQGQSHSITNISIRQDIHNQAATLDELKKNYTDFVLDLSHSMSCSDYF